MYCEEIDIPIRRLNKTLCSLGSLWDNMIYKNLINVSLMEIYTCVSVKITVFFKEVMYSVHNKVCDHTSGQYIALRYLPVSLKWQVLLCCCIRMFIVSHSEMWLLHVSCLSSLIPVAKHIFQQTERLCELKWLAISLFKIQGDTPLGFVCTSLKKNNIVLLSLFSLLDMWQ